MEHRDDDRGSRHEADSAAVTHASALAWPHRPALVWPPATALAQVSRRSTGPRQEIPAGPFVGVAYGFIWIAVLVYVVVRRPRAGPGEPRDGRAARKLDERAPDRADGRCSRLAHRAAAVVALHLHPGDLRAGDRARVHPRLEGDPRRHRLRAAEGGRAGSAHRPSASRKRPPAPSRARSSQASRGYTSAYAQLRFLRRAEAADRDRAGLHAQGDHPGGRRAGRARHVPRRDLQEGAGRPAS